MDRFTPYRTRGGPESEGGWGVGGDGIDVRGLDKALAHVWAWAASRVAEGRTLAATNETYECDVCEADTIVARYTGPTDGLAPTKGTQA